MDSPIEIHKNKTYERLFRIYTDPNRDLLLSVQKIISPNAEFLADYFYQNMLEIEESGQFLNHNVVSERLHRSMAAWIKSLFLPSDEMSVAEHMKWQQKVGDVHARINIPMKLVNYGIRLLKNEMERLLRESDLADNQKYQGLVLVNDLLDFSSSLINESYVVHHIHNENDSQALKTHLMSISLVVQLERLRSSMFDWLRKTVTEIYEGNPDQKLELPSAYTTDFGLWAIYKSELLFSERPDLIAQLKKNLEVVQENIDKINLLTGENFKNEIGKVVDSLSQSISSIAWLLGDISSQTYEMESGRDTLTRLLNRRFLTSVMQNMIKAARATSSTFSIISLDIDEFKQINDKYGHAIGDKALVFLGEVLTSNTRVTDYAFRMGGDEFTAILAGIDAKSSGRIAKKILEFLSTHPLNLDNGTAIHLKVSIGVAQYEGHPDYMRLLKDVDDALYQAKTNGKNTFYIKKS
jgi:diguanylate cyclase